jgi:glycosyltransferase involved in cell wall biosynthesis
MKIAIDVSPLSSGHKVRGVGFYLTYLKRALLEFYPDNEYYFFGQGDTIQSNVDLVHYPYFDPFFLTLPVFKKHKTIVTVHDLTPIIFPEHFPAGIKGHFQWEIQRMNLKRVEGILTDSAASKKDIEHIVRINSDKVTVAYLAAGMEFHEFKNEDSQLEKIRDKYKLPKEFILYVGDATWNKNLPLLLEVVKRINIPLVLVGKALTNSEVDTNNKWNSDLIKVQAIAKDNEGIKLLGFIPTEDLVVLYNLATLFVYPSVYEGFGLPILEAMQSGCPVIISRESCMPEVGGEAAEYFDGYNMNNLIAVIQKILNSKELQSDLSKKGIEQAKKFSWQKTAEQTTRAYERALKS